MNFDERKDSLGWSEVLLMNAGKTDPCWFR